MQMTGPAFPSHNERLGDTRMCQGWGNCWRTQSANCTISGSRSYAVSTLAELKSYSCTCGGPAQTQSTVLSALNPGTLQVQVPDGKSVGGSMPTHKTQLKGAEHKLTTQRWLQAAVNSIGCRPQRTCCSLWLHFNTEENPCTYDLVLQTLYQSQSHLHQNKNKSVCSRSV